jgi:hypothetical protein
LRLITNEANPNVIKSRKNSNPGDDPEEEDFVLDMELVILEGELVVLEGELVALEVVIVTVTISLAWLLEASLTLQTKVYVPLVKLNVSRSMTMFSTVQDPLAITLPSIVTL